MLSYVVNVVPDEEPLVAPTTETKTENKNKAKDPEPSFKGKEPTTPKPGEEAPLDLPPSTED